MHIKSGDLTRLRVSPDTCVVRKDQPDGWLSWFGSFTFSIQGRRRLTFINNCHSKNHPSAVNIHFHSTQGAEKKQESVHEIKEGETKVFFTDGTPIEPVLVWSDINKK